MQVQPAGCKTSMLNAGTAVVKVRVDCEINASLTPVQRGCELAQHLRPRRATSTTFAALSAKARPSRLARGRGSPGSVGRPFRILPFRQSNFSKQREPVLNAPVNRRLQKCRGPSHTRRRRRPRARTRVEKLGAARRSGAARDTLEAQLKKAAKFKAPRPAGRHDPPAATRGAPRRAGTPRRRRRRRPVQLVGRRLAEGRRGGRPRAPRAAAPERGRGGGGRRRRRGAARFR